MVNEEGERKNDRQHRSGLETLHEKKNRSALLGFPLRLAGCRRRTHAKLICLELESVALLFKSLDVVDGACKDHGLAGARLAGQRAGVALREGGNGAAQAVELGVEAFPVFPLDLVVRQAVRPRTFC